MANFFRCDIQIIDTDKILHIEEILQKTMRARIFYGVKFQSDQMLQCRNARSGSVKLDDRLLASSIGWNVAMRTNIKSTGHAASVFEAS